MSRFYPKGESLDISKDSFENLIQGVSDDLTWIDLRFLEYLVPQGCNNSWNSNPDDRIQEGFKYQWNSSTGVSYQVHGHEFDPEAPDGSRAKNNWSVRIKVGNKCLLSKKIYPETGPDRDHGTYWSSNGNYADLTHIPARLD